MLSLAAGLMVSAAAAGTPQLVVSEEAGISQKISLTGVPADCQSLQITLELSKNTTYTFAADSGLEARPGTYTTWKQTGSSVTIYVTVKSGTLTQNGTLDLGEIHGHESFTVLKSTEITMLDQDDMPIKPDEGTDVPDTGEPGNGDTDSGNTGDSGSGDTGTDDKEDGEGTEVPDAPGDSDNSDDDGDSGSSGTATRWAIVTKSTAGGQVTASAERARKGTVITLETLPQTGYTLSALTVTTADGDELTLTDLGEGRYKFTMPAAKVTVSAAFALEETAQLPSLPFVDMAADAWYREAVQYVYDKGMMTGTGENVFSPDMTTSRGMIVTILYRLEGSPAGSGATGFSDVADGQWYTDAVRWASERGIVNGYGNGTFGPNDPITREQMAAILFRYAQYKNCDVSGRMDLSGYTDEDQISRYAAGPMGWAVSEGLITGTTATTLEPTGSATRAQVATILMRFCTQVMA